MSEVSNATRIGRYITALVALTTFLGCVYLFHHHEGVFKHMLLTSFTLIGFLIFLRVAIPVSLHLSYEGLKEAYEAKKSSDSKFVRALLYLWLVFSPAVFVNTWWLLTISVDYSYLAYGLLAYCLSFVLGLLTFVRFWANKPPKA